MKEKKELFIDGEIIAVGLQNIDKHDNDLAIVFDSNDTTYTVYVDSYEFLKWFNKKMIKSIKEKLQKYITKI